MGLGISFQLLPCWSTVERRYPDPSVSESGEQSRLPSAWLTFEAAKPDEEAMDHTMAVSLHLATFSGCFVIKSCADVAGAPALWQCMTKASKMMLKRISHLFSDMCSGIAGSHAGLDVHFCNARQLQNVILHHIAEELLAGGCMQPGGGRQVATSKFVRELA